tara:strand:- start:597 stop:1067 length:471 start_codon:yes stop_codon:yes gene_type:complete
MNSSDDIIFKWSLLILIVSTIFCQTKEEFDPSRLNDIPPKWPQVIHSFVKNKTAITDTAALDTSLQELDGFRVQVFATRFSKSADSIKTVLEEKLDEELYIAFDAPVYKVRVGNFTTRNEAENMKIRLSNLGYDTAWIVRSKVFARKFRLIEKRKH